MTDVVARPPLSRVWLVWPVSVVLGLAMTLATLWLVAWLNVIPTAEPAPRAALEPIVVEQAPPPSPAPSSLPTDVPSLAPVQPAAPSAPTPAFEPSALSHLPQAHLPADSVSVLPGIGRGSLSGSLGDGLEEIEDVGLEVAAKPRTRPAPSYPADARRRGIEGHVVVRMRVDPSGRVTDVVVLESQPRGVFDEVAKQTARRYRFDPARKGGSPIETTVEQRIVFELR